MLRWSNWFGGTLLKYHFSPAFQWYAWNLWKVSHYFSLPFESFWVAIVHFLQKLTFYFRVQPEIYTSSVTVQTSADNFQSRKNSEEGHQNMWKVVCTSRFYLRFLPSNERNGYTFWLFYIITTHSSQQLGKKEFLRSCFCCIFIKIRCFQQYKPNVDAKLHWIEE